MAKETKLQKAFSELKKNPPAIIAKTRKQKGKKAAEKQRTAIALSKAGKSRKNRSA